MHLLVHLTLLFLLSIPATSAPAASASTFQECICEGSAFSLALKEHVRQLSTLKPLNKQECSLLCNRESKLAHNFNDYDVVEEIDHSPIAAVVSTTPMAPEVTPSPTPIAMLVFTSKKSSVSRTSSSILEGARTSTISSASATPTPLSQSSSPSERLDDSAPPLYDPAEPRPDPLFDSKPSKNKQSLLKPPPISKDRTEFLPPHTGAHVHPDYTPFPPSHFDSDFDSEPVAWGSTTGPSTMSIVQQFYDLIIGHNSNDVHQNHHHRHHKNSRIITATTRTIVGVSILIALLVVAIAVVVFAEKLFCWCMGSGRSRSRSSGAMGREREKARLWAEKLHIEEGR